MVNFKKLTFVAGVSLAAVCLHSCVETADIDLSKEIKKDIRLAPGGISIPLGDFKKVTLDSLLNLSDDPDAVLRKLKDGTYALSVSDSFDPTSVDVDDIILSVEDPEIDPVTISFGDFSLLPDATPVPGSTVSTPVTFETDIRIDQIVDDALILVSSVDMKSPSPVTVAFRFSGIPDCVTKVEMTDFSVQFPDYIRMSYSGTDSRVSLDGNTLTIEGVLKASEMSDGSSFDIPGIAIEGLRFETPKRTEIQEDGKRHFVLAAQAVGYQGNINITTANTTVGELKGKEVKMNSVLKFADMTLGAFTGKLFPEVKSVSSSFNIDLGDDASDILQADGNSMILSNPEILLTVSTDFSIPFVVDLNISSYDKAGNYICKNATPDKGTFTIPASPRGSKKSTAVLLYRNTKRSLDLSSDTVYVLVSKMSDLLSAIPDKVDFDLSVKADTSMTDEGEFHYVDLASDLEIAASYNVNVPLAFDELHMSYSTTLDGMSDAFEDVDSDIAVQLKGQIVNTIPMGLSITATPKDRFGNVLDFVSATNATVKAGTEANPSTSDLLIGIDLKGKNASELDALELSIGFDSDPEVGTAVLKGSQYVEIKNVSLCLPKGMTIVIEDEDDK